MGTLFVGGTIVTAGEQAHADLLVDGERVAAWGLNLPRDGHQIVDCTGRLLLPGGLDAHTHFALPFGRTTSNDDFAGGGRAAAFGGTTSHIDFATPPFGGDALHALHARQRVAAPSPIDHGLHIVLREADDRALAALPALADAGATGVKVFMAYKGVYQLSDADLLRVMRAAAAVGLPVLVHAENGDAVAFRTAQLAAAGDLAPAAHARSRPASVEAEATARAVMLAALSGCALYVVHVTCAGAVAALREGRARGADVRGETCIQYLALTAAALDQPGLAGASFVCSPPLRGEADQAALWDGLRDGTLIHVSTDHCAFWTDGGRGPWQAWEAAHPDPNGVDWAAYEAQDPAYRRPGKEQGRHDFRAIPNGLPGVEQRLPLLWQLGVGGGQITPQQFVALGSTHAAGFFRLAGKGSLAPGHHADLLVWDAAATHTIRAAHQHTRCDTSPYEGWAVRGWPVQVWARGRCLVAEDGTWGGVSGAGQFLRAGHAGPPHG